LVSTTASLRRNLRNVYQSEIPANSVATIPKAMSVKPNCFALVCISIASGVWGLLAHCAENLQKLDILAILISS